MRKLVLLSSSTLLSLASSVGCSVSTDDTIGSTTSEVIYGTDDRQDPSDYSDAAWAARTIEFTAAVIPSSQVDTSDPNDISIGDRTYAERFDLCPGVRFEEQPAVADCSATLIAEDTILTAGHCINNCNDSFFVFDYRMNADGTRAPITSDDVYQCDSFLGYAQSNTGLDYAVVHLERPVVGRTPAAVRTSSEPLAVGTPLVVSGFPSGLPLKIADNATVRSSDAATELFKANLDTFRGNSGSGVFDATTQELVGILVRGETDFVQDGDCLRPNECPDDGCRGETSVYAFQALRDACENMVSPLCSCGDGACGPLESPASCSSDCSCGDGVCSTGETTGSCPADCTLEVLYDDHATQPNWVTPGLQVRNAGSSFSYLVDVTVRYYFSKEPAGSLAASCWGCSTMPNVSFHEVPGGGCAEATHYMDVEIPEQFLSAGQTTPRFPLAFHASSWQPFVASNDHSYGGPAADYTPNQDITMYQFGERVFGTEPCPGLFIPAP